MKYKPGKANVDVDVLCRLPCYKPGYISSDVVHDLCKVEDDSDADSCLVQSLRVQILSAVVCQELNV